MKCDNCEAQVKNGERYCPECGMELVVPDHKSSNYRKSDKKGYKKSDKGKGRKKSYKGNKKSDYQGNGYRKDNDKDSNYGVHEYKKSGYKRSSYKPLQRKHMEGGYREGEYYEGERRNDEYSHLPEDEFFEDEKAPHKNEYNYEEPKKSSGFLFFFLVLLIALAVGFFIGLMMFSIPQSIPSIPINQS